MADISEYLRRQAAKGPKRKKREGEARTLWNSPTAAAQDEAVADPKAGKKDQEKQLSPIDKTSIKKTPNSKTSISKASSEKTPASKTSNNKTSTHHTSSKVDAKQTAKEAATVARTPTKAPAPVVESAEVLETSEARIEPSETEASSVLEMLEEVIEELPAADVMEAVPVEDPIEDDMTSNVMSENVVEAAPRIVGALLADDLSEDFDGVELKKDIRVAQVNSLPHSESAVSEELRAAHVVPLIEVPPKVPAPTLAPVAPFTEHVDKAAEAAHPQVSSQPILTTPVVRPRSRPVTVGKAPSLPPPPSVSDLTKDERFLAKYWLSPGPGGVPRSQERFFHFYRFLYSEAVRTGSGRVYCTEDMAVEMLGPKARGTFTNYRKLGQQYGMFSVHIVGNLGRRDDCLPGTYFFLQFPWINQ